MPRIPNYAIFISAEKDGKSGFVGPVSLWLRPDGKLTNYGTSQEFLKYPLLELESREIVDGLFGLLNVDEDLRFAVEGLLEAAFDAGRMFERDPRAAAIPLRGGEGGTAWKWPKKTR
jgi:hypothetical protein